MKNRGKIVLLAVILAALGLLTAVLILLQQEYGYARSVDEAEQAVRDGLVMQAESWLGCAEADGTHRPIIDIYNAHTPLARGYTVTYTDNWCATFVSACAISCGITDIIPTECGCERQLELFRQLDRWVEDDGYVPLPGDIIYYCRSDSGFGDCTGWSDHVGIVVGTRGPYIKVIEGNRGDSVSYNILTINSSGIRGYGILFSE